MKRLTMKSIVALIISMAVVFGVFSTSVFAFEVSQKSLTVSDKSSTVTVKKEGIGNLEVSPDIEFDKVGDYIVYKLVLTNKDGEKYKIISVTDDNKNEYVKTSYTTDNELNAEDKEILITIKYEKEFDGSDFSSETIKSAIKATIKLIDEKEKEIEIEVPIDNPKTEDNIGKHLILFISAGLVIILMYNSKKRRHKGRHVKRLVVLMFAVVLVPVVAFANHSTELPFTLNFEAIKIAKYHTITFDTDGGSKAEVQNIKDGQKMTMVNPTRADYIFVGWMDEEGNEFDVNAPITGDVKLKAKWRVARARIIGVEVEYNNRPKWENELARKIRQMANPGEQIEYGYGFKDYSIKATKRATEEQYEEVKENLTDENIVSSEDSLVPIYIWFDSEVETLYWYTEAEKIQFVGSMGRLFAKCYALEDISVCKDFDVAEVTDMNRLFQNCINLGSLKPLENWNVSKVINMSWMFGYTETSDDTGMAISDLEPLANWDVSNVKSMQQMFKKCINIKTLKHLAKWNVSSVGYTEELDSADNQAFQQMFNYCRSLDDASAIEDWDINNAVTSALKNEKTIEWSFTQMLKNTLVKEKQKPFTSWKPGGSWSWEGGVQSKGTFVPNPAEDE